MSQAISNQYNTAFSPTEHLTGTGDDLDKDSFLVLMVTQLQYQDPLNPAEDTEFVAQLAQFNSLEQMMNMNESMTGLVEAQNKALTVSSASFIGLDVAASGYGVSVNGGKASEVLYACDDDIASGAVNIFNSNMEMVASVPLSPTAPGVHKFEWDGYLSDGSVAADGVYTIALSAFDANGDTVVTQTQVSGKVDGVSSYNGEQFLKLTDGRIVALSEVTEILKPEDVTTETDPEVDSEDPDDSKDPEDPDDPNANNSGTNNSGTGTTP